MRRELIDFSLLMVLVVVGTTGCDIVVRVTPTPVVVAPTVTFPIINENLVCRNDADCNPDIANPSRFTRQCLNSDGTKNRFNIDGYGVCE